MLVVDRSAFVRLEEGSVQGTCNTAQGDYSSVSGGRQNPASGSSSSVSGGFLNTASGAYSSVVGGALYEASGDRAFVFALPASSLPSASKRL